MLGARVVASRSCSDAEITLLIVAGGNSRRMGGDKLMLPVPPKGTPLVRHVAELLLPLATKVLVVANDPEVCAAVREIGEDDSELDQDGVYPCKPVTCLPDDAPGAGPLGGLATGLRRIDGWALTVAGDMPFLSAATCRYLFRRSDLGCDAVVPVLEGRSQPLHALYNRRCLPAVERALSAGLRRMDSFWKEVRVRMIPADYLRTFDPELRTFTNVNTPTEWEEARALLSQG